ncbi:MAG TPA: alpha/beta fold hydrolase [Jatrophihabitans sp.]|nr:alpha/beta fold hydrolase [Jatrophihabitans sp.]
MIRQPGYVSREHTVQVPLDHARPDGPTIEVFAREVVAAHKAADGSAERLPWLLYLQGGPGGRSPRPADSTGWLGVALETHRVLLLDQRGTGRSTPVTGHSVAGRTAAQIADHLRHFRADAIVADAERLRAALGVDRWDTLGQSYGGFLTLTYLSRAPEALRTCYVTGGLPGITATAEEVYRRTFPRMAARTAEFYRRYPDDEAALQRLAEHLDGTEVRLPDGDLLTTRRLRTVGGAFGMSDGFEKVHWLLEQAWAGAELSDRFRYDVMLETGFVDGPLFALQEYIYGQGAATRWAAQREYESRPEFAESATPLLLTAEMMFPWMFREIRVLRPFADAAEILAEVDDWPALYDAEVLARNEVPLLAAVYHDDIYVDADLQLRTVAEVGAARAWVTNEHEHDGINASEHVLRRLFDMAAGRC